MNRTANNETKETYTVDQLVTDLDQLSRQGKSQQEFLQIASGYVRNFASNKHTFLQPDHLQCDPEQGFGMHLLHEQPDHSFAVLVVVWMPGRGTPPHNHKTWAIVTGLEGLETNCFWERQSLDPAHPKFHAIQQTSERKFGFGEVLAMGPEEIHSVKNESTQLSVSLHVYGRHINFTNRAKFDPAREIEEVLETLVRLISAIVGCPKLKKDPP